MNDFKNREFALREKESNAVLHKYPKSLPIIIYPKYNDTPKLSTQFFCSVISLDQSKHSKSIEPDLCLKTTSLTLLFPDGSAS